MHYVLFACIALTALASNLAVLKVGRNPALTVSQHVAKTHWNITMFRIVFGAATVCFGVWTYFWLHQNIHLSLVGVIAFAAIAICFAGAALLPYIEKTRGGTIHNFLAWGLVYLFPIAIADIVIANPDANIRNYGVAALTLLLVLLAGYITIRSQRKFFLYYQVAYVLVFFAYMSLLALYV